MVMRLEGGLVEGGCGRRRGSRRLAIGLFERGTDGDEEKRRCFLGGRFASCRDGGSGLTTALLRRLLGSLSPICISLKHRMP